MQKYQYFNGVKFTRDEKTGYYLNSTMRKRIHRYVWEFYNGEIPKGMHIHHKDHNKSNNDISNLELMSVSEHTRLHAIEKVKKNYNAMIKNLNEVARPKASEWHKSEDGRKHHKEMYQKFGKFRLHQKVDKICEMCKCEYSGEKGEKSRFCSNKCKSAWRRKEGLDNIERKCIFCENIFIVNKYCETERCQEHKRKRK